MADRQSNVERVRDSKVGGMCCEEGNWKGKMFELKENIGYSAIKYSLQS